MWFSPAFQIIVCLASKVRSVPGIFCLWLRDPIEIWRAQGNAFVAQSMWEKLKPLDLLGRMCCFYDSKLALKVFY